VFVARLAASAEAAWAFAQTQLIEQLPESLEFRVRLNRSYDGDAPGGDEVRFPEDSAPQRAVALNRCSAATAVGELWRDGRVPEWIDVAVVDETGTTTVVELVCCGRYTADEGLLYHIAEGVPPFHVLGPTLPPGHDGTPFSIHLRAECWGRSDLEHLTTHANTVWSLSLMTDQFDNDALRALPVLPNLEIFEHEACALGNDATAAFVEFPKLRVLRLSLTPSPTFHIAADGHRLGLLTDLSIANLPDRAWGHEALAEVAPGLTSVHLAAKDTLWLGAFAPSIDSVSIVAARMAGPTKLPAALDHLAVWLDTCTDGEIATLLDGLTHARSVSLRGTPVSDAILALLDRFTLEHLDLVDTAVSATALAEFRSGHPSINLLPRARPFSS